MGSSYGPEKYVVEYKYDDAGRTVRKVVKDNPKDPDATRYESDYEFDGMGRMIRERIWRWDMIDERMVVTQDTQTTYPGVGMKLKFHGQGVHDTWLENSTD